jgi:hypothetical protein
MTIKEALANAGAFLFPLVEHFFTVIPITIIFDCSLNRLSDAETSSA